MSKPNSVTFEMILRDRNVEITCVVCGPDPSVGILSRWSEEWAIKDVDTGEEIDWELTDAEVENLDYVADVTLAEIENSRYIGNLDFS